IQRDELQKKIYQELNMSYKPRAHMMGSPILYIAMAISYFILRKGRKKTSPAKNKILKSKTSNLAGVIRCPSCNTYQFSKKLICPNCGYNLAESETEKTSSYQSTEAKKSDIAEETPKQKWQALTEKRPPDKTLGNEAGQSAKEGEVMPNNEIEEFPYMAELNRRIYARLLKEERDEASMLQAKAECGGNEDKIEAAYYKIRYKQVIESGEVDELKAEILAEKKSRRLSEQAGGRPQTEEMEGTSAKDVPFKTLSQAPTRVTEQNFIDFIGANASYYLPKFNKFSVGASSITWHWPACLATFWWLLYRKLYLWVLVFFILLATSGIISRILTASELTFWILIAPELISLILFGMFGNYIYYSHAKKKILKTWMKHQTSELSDIRNSVQSAGGVNRWLWPAAIIISILGILGLCLAILIPQFAANKKSSSRFERSPAEEYHPSTQGKPTNLRPPDKKSRILSPEERFKLIEDRAIELMRAHPDKDPKILQAGLDEILSRETVPENYPAIEDLERLGRERMKRLRRERTWKTTHTYPDGGFYDGEVKNGERHGYGTYIFPDGSTYVGYWRNGKFHGKGTVTLPDGRKQVGQFRNGKYISE
nr:DUF2628 domain-containing protein [Desulfobacterales bacterium]